MRPAAMRQRIALFGNFGTGNLGNEATLQAMVYNLRRYLPNAEISCICPGPENTASQYNIFAVPIRVPFPIRKVSSGSNSNSGASNGSISGATTEPYRRIQAFDRLTASLRFCAYPFVDAYRWFKCIAGLKNSNLLIMTGTGMVADYAIGPFDLHYDLFRWAIAAKLCRCKLLFVSVGGGPIRHPLSKYFVKTALALADYRSYRDVSSKDHLEAIGVDVTNDAVYPDLAFSLPRVVTPVHHDPDRQGIVVGVGVMNYRNRFGRSGNDETIYRDYLGRIASFVVRLLERRYTVRVLIGDFIWDQGVRRDLRRELEERGCNYEDGRIIDEPASSVDELLTQLASVDVVVSSRFHNLLLGLMLEKPAIAISYHEKFQPLMSGVGLDQFCCDIEQIDVDKLIKMVVKLVEDAPSIAPQIAPKIEGYGAALDEQYMRIFEVSPPARITPRGSRTA
jgi:polysaccharide pyruvyl transferase WcaK-like protein